MKKSLNKGKDSQGRFTKGNQYGRPKGSIARLGMDLREDLADFLYEELPAVKAELRKLDGLMKIRMFIDLAAFVLPKLKATDEPILGILSDDDLDRIIQRLRAEMIQN